MRGAGPTLSSSRGRTCAASTAASARDRAHPQQEARDPRAGPRKRTISGRMAEPALRAAILRSEVLAHLGAGQGRAAASLVICVTDRGRPR